MKVKRLDIPALKKLLKCHNSAIIELWRNLPNPGLPLIDEDDEQTNQKKKKMKLLPHGEKTTRARSLQELHEKLENLKGKRLVYKEKLVKKGLKNRLNKKKKKEENILKKKSLKRKLIVSDVNTGLVVTHKPMKQIYNDEGKLVFNKFDFSDSGTSSMPSKKEKDPKDPRKLLDKLEKQNEKLKQLESEGDVDRAKAIKEKHAWKTALQKAEGVKVKDNPELLKKSMRKDIERKRKSKKKWEARTDKVKQQQQEKQAKRTENIQARKRQNKLKKMKKAAKKGRIIPGF